MITEIPFLEVIVFRWQQSKISSVTTGFIISCGDGRYGERSLSNAAIALL